MQLIDTQRLADDAEGAVLTSLSKGIEAAKSRAQVSLVNLVSPGAVDSPTADKKTQDSKTYVLLGIIGLVALAMVVSLR